MNLRTNRHTYSHTHILIEKCFYYRPSGLISDLSENGSRPSSVNATVSSTAASIGCLEGVTVKTSSSPPPAHHPSSIHNSGGPVASSLLNQLNQLNQHVIVPPMLGMLQQAHSNSGMPLTDTLLSRHFSQIAHAMNNHHHHHQQQQQQQSNLQHTSHDSASSTAATTTTTTSARGMFVHITNKVYCTTIFSSSFSLFLINKQLLLHGLYLN